MPLGHDSPEKYGATLNVTAVEEGIPSFHPQRVETGHRFHFPTSYLPLAAEWGRTLCLRMPVSFIGI
jgi:hypothetical protein